MSFGAPRQVLMLLLTTIFCVTGLPLISKHDTFTPERLETSFLQALNEWDNDRVNLWTTLKAKGEMDRFLVHRHLFHGLAPEVWGKLSVIDSS